MCALPEWLSGNWPRIRPTSSPNDCAAIYDVIIAGAGPVGLFLACELRLVKLSVLVLEKLEDPHSPLKRLPFSKRQPTADVGCCWQATPRTFIHRWADKA